MTGTGGTERGEEEEGEWMTGTGGTERGEGEEGSRESG